MKSWQIILLGSCALAASACVALLGDDFEISSETAGAGGQGGQVATGGDAGGTGGLGGSGGSGGQAPTPGTHQWSHRWGNAEAELVWDVACDPNGQIVVVGSFSGSVDFGVETLQAFGTDAFVLKLNAEGQPAWVRSFGALGATVEAVGVAVDASGNIAVTGQFEGDVDFGGGPLLSADIDAFVLKLTANGAFAAATAFGDALDPDAPQKGRAVSITPSGQVVVAGNFANSVRLSQSVSHSSPAAQAFFVAVLDENLHHVASEGFGTLAFNEATDLAADASSIYLTGGFELTLGIGLDVHSTVGGRDLFIAKLDMNAEPIWSHAFGSNENDSSSTLARAPGGTLFAIAGWMAGAVDFGGGALPFGGGDDAMVAAFAGQAAHQMSRSAGGANVQRASGVAIGPNATLFTAGRFTGEMNWGGDTLQTPPGIYGFHLAELDETGGHVFSKGFVSSTDQKRPVKIAATPDGGVVLTGSFEGAMDFGGGVLESAGATDIFVAKFD